MELVKAPQPTRASWIVALDVIYQRMQDIEDHGDVTEGEYLHLSDVFHMKWLEIFGTPYPGRCQ
jgi:hypothetical protein